MSTTLFGRNWLVSIGDVEITDLTCEFTVKRTLQAIPNTCELRVYNLAPATRKKLTAPKVVLVRIEAGYGSTLDQIYLGDARAVQPGELVGPDEITTVSSGDAEHPLAYSRIGVPVGAKTSTATALRAIVRALTKDLGVSTPIGPGNVEAVASTLATKGRVLFPRATVLHGNTARVMTDFCRSANLEWSIQDGVLQILDLGQPLAVHPYSLSASSGLYGSPKLESDGTVSFDTAMIPALRPGMRVELDTKYFTGLYRVNQCTYKGSTTGEEWGISVVCDKRKPVAT